MSGKYSRTKGANGERSIVNLLKERGVIAKRISMMETGGIDKGDVLVADIWKAQVKVGGHVPDFLYKVLDKGENMAFLKRDRKDWLVVLNLEWFIETFL